MPDGFFHLFPPSEFPKLTERQYAFRARDCLRKVLAKLKEHMKCTERLMCHHRGAEIQYRKVHACCLNINAKVFEKHDPVRFVEKLAKRKGKVNTGALQPHQVLMQVLDTSSSFHQAIAQAQWPALLAHVRLAGFWSNCIAVCDVSGSMSAPAAPNASLMDIAIAMSLLLAQVADGPLARHVITFHRTPQLVKLPETDDLVLLYQFFKKMEWGSSTNFHKVFDLSKSASPPPRQVFVFSDMYFASAGGNETVLRKVQKEYNKLGLELPELVFWNLASSIGHLHWPTILGSC